MRKLLSIVAALVAGGLLLVATGAAVDVPVSYQGIKPVLVAGNPDCKDLTGLWPDKNHTYNTQLKFVAPIDGTNGGGFTVTRLSGAPVGTGIGWYVAPNWDLRAVIVKGGPSANVYFYPNPGHPEGDFVDGSMTTPGTFDSKKGWKFPELSYVEFCYTPTLYVPPSPT